MSDNIPFDIQTEIMKRLLVIPLIRFRSVSKQLKSLIDSSKFIKDHSQYQHRLLARYKLETDQSDIECECISIIKNNDVFANQKSSLTLPLLLSSFVYIRMYNSINEFLCFHGWIDPSGSTFYVFWNPTVGKSVAIKFPNGLWINDYIGFGFCPDNLDPKLVRIKIHLDTRRWEVDIFTLSSRVWKRVFSGYKSVYDRCGLTRDHVCIKGYACIYWQPFDFSSHQCTNVIISFGFKSEMFGKVCLPDTFSLTHEWRVVEVNESLGVLEYDGDGGCCVWIMEFVTKSFTKMFTVKVPDQLLYNGVFEFRKIGDNN